MKWLVFLLRQRCSCDGGFRLYRFVADPVGEDKSSERYWDHGRGPEPPSAGIIRTGCADFRERIGIQDRLETSAEVNKSVDDADCDAGVFRTSKVHRSRAREHAMHADDAERHENHEP